MSQIRLQKSKQKPFVVCCAEGIVPRIGENRFQIVIKLSACQISGIRREGFGKLGIEVLLTQGCPGEKMRFSMTASRLKIYDIMIRARTRARSKSKPDRPSKVYYYCY